MKGQRRNGQIVAKGPGKYLVRAYRGRDAPYGRLPLRVPPPECGQTHPVRLELPGTLHNVYYQTSRKRSLIVLPAGSLSSRTSSSFSTRT